MPIEAMRLSYDGKWLATSSHDETVHLWDTYVDEAAVFPDADETSDMTKREGNFDYDDDSDDDSDSSVAKPKHKISKISFGSDTKTSFFAGLD